MAGLLVPVVAGACVGAVVVAAGAVPSPGAAAGIVAGVDDAGAAGVFAGTAEVPVASPAALVVAAVAAATSAAVTGGL